MPTIIAKPTNMAKAKCLEYSCIQICDIEDAKVIN